MPHQYSMRQAQKVAEQATKEIETWLRGRPETVSVVNVENDPAFQAIDVDLVWQTHKRTYRIEIKCDRYYRTGNFFLETQSNAELGTPGCMLYTQADFVFYYFVQPKILFVLPMPATRDWFLKNLARFLERKTTTPTSNEKFYTTIGRLVPREILRAEVANVREIKLA